jgi:hypothetical protein
MRICIQEPSIKDLRFTRFYLMEGEDKIDAFKDYAPFVICKPAPAGQDSLRILHSKIM